jgi:hypothetical protein
MVAFEINLIWGSKVKVQSYKVFEKSNILLFSFNHIIHHHNQRIFIL